MQLSTSRKVRPKANQIVIQISIQKQIEMQSQEQIQVVTPRANWRANARAMSKISSRARSRKHSIAIRNSTTSMFMSKFWSESNCKFTQQSITNQSQLPMWHKFQMSAGSCTRGYCKYNAAIVLLWHSYNTAMITVQLHCNSTAALIQSPHTTVIQLYIVHVQFSYHTVM